jgi:hypothetical protein
MKNLWLRWRLRNKTCTWCDQPATTIREEHPACAGCADLLDRAAGEAAELHFGTRGDAKAEVERFTDTIAQVLFALHARRYHMDSSADVAGAVMVAEAALQRLERSVVAGWLPTPDEALAIDLDYMRRALTPHWRCRLCNAKTAENCGGCDRGMCTQCATGYLHCRDCDEPSAYAGGEPVESLPRGSAGVDDEVSDAATDGVDDGVDAPARCSDCNTVLGCGPWVTRPFGPTSPICDSCSHSWEDLLDR